MTLALAPADDGVLDAPEFFSTELDTGCAEHRMARLNVVRCLEEMQELIRWVEHHTATGTALGCDSETNARNPWDPGFQLRTVQLADTETTWVVVVEDLDVLGRSMLADLIRSHPYWVGHFSRSEVNFMGRGLPGCWRFESDEPHIADLQVVLGYYDPRTLMPEAKDGIDPRLAHKRGLKETTTRELSPVLAQVEKAMHERWRTVAPKGHRTPAKYKAWGFANISSHDPLYLAYAGLDPLMTVRLWNKFVPVVKAAGRWPITKEDLHTQWDADKAMFRGLPVDATYAVWLDKQLADLITHNAAKLAEFDIAPSGSGPNVGKAFESLGVQSPKRTKPTESNPEGNPSWDKEVIKDLIKSSPSEEDPAVVARWGHDADVMAKYRAALKVHELAEAVQAVRKATKFASAYVKPMLEAIQLDGRVHCDLRVIGTVTGRMSARDPALQQLPKKDTRVRAAYTALPGHVIVSCDFNQGEPRTMAGRSGDKALLEVILSGDLNDAIAASAFGDAFVPVQGKQAGTPSYLMRQGAKMGFLAKCYGAAIGRVATSIGVTFEAAKLICTNWENDFPDLWAYGHRLNQQEAVVLASGRMCPLWDRYTVDESGALRVYPKPSRKALNYDTQGSQRDLLTTAWRRMVAWGWGWALYFFVHDEILLSVPEFMAESAKAALKAAMTFDFHGVPIECEAEINGWTWLEQPGSFDTRELEAVDA